MLPGLTPALSLPLGAASIDSNGKHILLVSQAEYCLLKADTGSSDVVPLRYTVENRERKVSDLHSEEQHLAGGVILEQLQTLHQKAGSSCTFLLWDWSGVLSLNHVGDGQAENRSVSIAPRDLNHFQKIGEGYIAFLQDRTGDVYGAWSKSMDDWYVGVSTQAARITNDAGVCAFKFRGSSLSPIASMSLSKIWVSEEEENEDIASQGLKVPAPGLHNCQVTCLTIVGGIGSSPHTLVQGYSNGDIIFSPLADYAIPGVLSKMHLEMQNRTQHRRCGHWGSITCFLEMTYLPAADPLSKESGFLADAVILGGQGRAVLASGAEDGSIMFWNLEAGKVGELMFSVHPHIGMSPSTYLTMVAEEEARCPDHCLLRSEQRICCIWAFHGRLNAHQDHTSGGYVTFITSVIATQICDHFLSGSCAHSYRKRSTNLGATSCFW